MIKKIISAIVFCMLGVLPANAEDAKPSIAILDTAIDSSLPIFNGRIIHEVCILDWPSCPNGYYYMEGSGSASLASDIISRNGFSHGTQMASIFALNNLNTNIIFIRIIAHSLNGSRMPSTEQNVAEAMKWVLDNKDKYNIQAVSMSQGHHNLLYYKQYCPISKNLQPILQALKDVNIPVFIASGNNGANERINWPSCIKESIAVGAIDLKNNVASYSNNDYNLIDFYASGNSRAFTVGGKSGIATGTSVATQIAAAQWLQIKQSKQLTSYDEIYNLISKTSTNVKSNRVVFGKLINLKGAING